MPLTTSTVHYVCIAWTVFIRRWFFVATSYFRICRPGPFRTLSGKHVAGFNFKKISYHCNYLVSIVLKILRPEIWNANIWFCVHGRCIDTVVPFLALKYQAGPILRSFLVIHITCCGCATAYGFSDAWGCRGLVCWRAPYHGVHGYFGDCVPLVWLECSGSLLTTADLSLPRRHGPAFVEGKGRTRTIKF